MPVDLSPEPLPKQLPKHARIAWDGATNGYYRSDIEFRRGDSELAESSDPSEQGGVLPDVSVLHHLDSGEDPISRARRARAGTLRRARER